MDDHLRDCLLLPFSCGHGGTRRGHFKIELGKDSKAYTWTFKI